MPGAIRCDSDVGGARNSKRGYVTVAAVREAVRSTVEVVNRPHQRRIDPFGLAALVASGTLVAHEIAYFVGGSGSVSHSYFGLLGPLVVVMGCVAAWIAAVSILRNDIGRLPSLGAIAALQSVVFAGMEVAERIAGGSLASLVSAPVIIGLGLQPIVAFVATRVLAIGRRLVESFRATSPRAVAHVLVDAAAPLAVPVSSLALVRLRLRGPPV